MNRKVFYDQIRKHPFGGQLTASQVDGIGRILDFLEKRDGIAPSPMQRAFWANMLGQVFHETGGRMQPIREQGGEAYLRKKKYYPWVGEGLVQVTWEANHRKFGATAPGQLLTWEKALPAMYDGMMQGLFTGKKLADYWRNGRFDHVGARFIINGKRKKTDFYADRALDVAKYCDAFEVALTAAFIARPVAPSDAASRADAWLQPVSMPPDVEKVPEKAVEREFSWFRFGFLFLALIAVAFVAWVLIGKLR